MKTYRMLSHLFLIVILLLGAYLRLYKISEYMTFLGDEGRDALIVKRIIVDHKLTLLGPTASVGGFFLGPIYYYFMAPFLWLWKLDPTGPAVMVALFGVVTIYLVYKVGRSLFNPLVGFIASSIYAVSPLVIAYSRSSWNPNLVPFFSLLLIYLLWRASQHNGRAIFWGIGVTLGVGLQLHYLFLFLFIVVALWILLYRRGISYVNHYLFLFVGFLVGYSPFFAFEIRHGFSNTKTIMNFLFAGKDTGFSVQTFVANVSDVIFRSFARLVFRFPQKEMLENMPKVLVSFWSMWIYSATTLSMFFGLRSIVFGNSGLSKTSWTEDDKQRNGWKLLFLWFFIVVFLFGFYKRAIYDYYLGIIFPVPFLFVGLVLSQLFSRPKGAIVASIFWGGLLFLNWQGRPFIYQPNNQLAQTKNIAQAAYQMTEGRPFNFALIANFNSDHAYRYFFEIWGNSPIPIENEAIDSSRSTVTNQLIVICEQDTCQPIGNSLWEIAGFGRAEIDRETSVPFVKIFKLIHYKEKAI